MIGGNCCCTDSVCYYDGESIDPLGDWCVPSASPRNTDYTHDFTATGGAPTVDSYGLHLSGAKLVSKEDIPEWLRGLTVLVAASDDDTAQIGILCDKDGNSKLELQIDFTTDENNLRFLVDGEPIAQFSVDFIGYMVDHATFNGKRIWQIPICFDKDDDGELYVMTAAVITPLGVGGGLYWGVPYGRPSLSDDKDYRRWFYTGTADLLSWTWNAFQVPNDCCGQCLQVQSGAAQLKYCDPTSPCGVIGLTDATSACATIRSLADDADWIAIFSSPPAAPQDWSLSDWSGTAFLSEDSSPAATIVKSFRVSSKTDVTISAGVTGDGDPSILVQIYLCCPLWASKPYPVASVSTSGSSSTAVTLLPGFYTIRVDYGRGYLGSHYSFDVSGGLETVGAC